MEIDLDHISFEESEKEEVETNQNIREEDTTPWMTKRTADIRNPNIRLHMEIIDFYNYIAPTKGDNENRFLAYEKVRKIIEQAIPGTKLLPFGSYITQVYLPNSDVDLVLMSEEEDKNKLLRKCSKVILKDTSVFSNVEVVKGARIPIIKFTESESQIEFDITFNEVGGLAVLEEIKKAFQTHPEIKYLILLMKLFLRQRKLNNSFTGGIGSFLLFCMILSFLRYYKSNIVERYGEFQLEKVTLGDYLLNFLKFYGQDFDFQRKEIDMVDGGAILNKRESSFNFSLWSPQDPNHNIGNQCFKFKEIFGVFRNRYNFVSNYPMEVGKSILKHLINPSNKDFEIYIK